MKHERYFFKEGIDMSKLKQAEALVDLAFDESFEIFGKATKAEKQVEKILDALGEKEDEVDLGQGTSYQMRPYDHPKKIRVVADVEECDGMMGGGPMNKGISDPEDEEMPNDGDTGFEDGEYDEGPEKADNPKKHQNDINQVPNQKGRALYATIRKQMSEMHNLDEAEKSKLLGVFKSLLTKWKGADTEMDTDAKQLFAKTVGREWKSKKLQEFRDLTEAEKESYKAYFKKLMKKFGVNSPQELDDEKKKAFYNAVDKGWKAKTESFDLSEGMLKDAGCEAARRGLIKVGDFLKKQKAALKACKKENPKDKAKCKPIEDKATAAYKVWIEWDKKRDKYCK